MGMKWISTAFLITALPVSMAVANESVIMLTPDEIEWEAVTEGPQSVVLYGDPAAQDMFAIRVRAPEGASLSAHTHSVREVLTVVSGTLRIGVGTEPDKAEGKMLPAGSFVVLPAGTPHYVFVEEDSVAQITTTGPWGRTFVDPAGNPVE
jgi:quercetin dioxygenase-like cupin family protein